MSYGHCDLRLALLPPTYTLATELRCANTTADESGGDVDAGNPECGSFLNQCSKYLDLTAPLMLGALPATMVKRG